jgi:hypothetical protein
MNGPLVADPQSKKTWQFLALFPPPKLFWSNIGRRPVARANVIRAARVGKNEE